MVELAQILPPRKAEIEPWLLLELSSKSKFWVEELESALFNSHNAGVLVNLLPPFYEALDVPDRGVRIQRLQQRAIQLLMKEKQFAPALATLVELPERQPKLEAVCHEGLGNFRSAAECHRLSGNLKEALTCYRSIPDLEAALKLVGEIGEHPAAESLLWISEMQKLVEKRPEKFTKTIMPAEKKLLEDILERSLGVTRRKPAPRKATAKKKTAAPRKPAPKKTERNTKPYF